LREFGAKGKMPCGASSHRDGDEVVVLQPNSGEGGEVRYAVLRGSCQGLKRGRFFARLRRGSSEVAGRQSLVVAEEWLPEVELCCSENGEERLE
jgi:hypothetical protein